MENATIDWARHFDRVFCIHFCKNEKRLAAATEEFCRVGLLDSGIFEWRYTYPDPWEVKLLDAYPKLATSPNRATAIAFLNLGLESCRIMRECAVKGYRRVLFLEDDIRFLRDLGALREAVDALPDGGKWDIVQLDKFAVWELKPEDYARQTVEKSINAHYFDVTGGFWMSGGCFAATARGMANMLRAMEEWRPGPMDGYLNMNGNTHAAAKRNLAVQVMFGDAMCQHYMGRRNTHHLAYRPQGIRYEDYAVPQGYGYDAVFAQE